MIEFRDFYRAIHGHTPFEWQQWVARRIVEHGWPERDVLDPPTASGKTSMLDIAVYALAAQAGVPALQRSAPLRTFFVIDRRLVVDDVTRHAVTILEGLEKPELHEIRERLMSFGGERPLEVATLRGGMYHDDTWADLPNQPLLCIATVDQAGSRLLFRGYGLNDRRRPIDAGLLGCDSLFIVDEAHLSTPFLDTLGWVQKYAGWAETPVAPPPRVLEMTATSKAESGFELPEDIFERDPELRGRLTAIKRAELRETADVVADATQAAKKMMSAPEVNVVGVVVNRVSTARAIFENLRDNNEGAVLLTGRIRPYDRDRLIETFLPRMRTGRDRSLPPLFVVATQTVEVGADLDFDALITEAAPLDALRQRFGRLNRLGTQKQAAALVLRPRRKKNEADRIYGEALDNAWEWLKLHAVESAIDFGAFAMRNLYRSHQNHTVNSGAWDGSVMFPAHIESWVQTNPSPQPDPDVAPFLHGAEHGAPEVNLVWRADLTESVDEWHEIVQAAPPLGTEALALPLWAAQRWLAGEATTDVADIETSGDAVETPSRPHLIWRGPDDAATGPIRPGDTIIVHSREGGADPFGWTPYSADPVADIGDECANERAEQGGGRYRLRLRPEEAPADEEDVSDELLKLARERFPHVKGWKVTAYPGGRYCAISKWTKPRRQTHRPRPMSEDSNDEDSASFIGGTIELARHVDDVVLKVGRFAERCGLDETVGNSLIRAAELHDLGKWDARFQEMLDPERDPKEPPLAKSQGRGSPSERRWRRQYAGYPKDARHEFWSVALVDEAQLIADDLVRHLIGTHHGYGRPLPPFWRESESITAKHGGKKITAMHVTRWMEFGSGWVDCFWALNRRYGYWGLAYLEAVLRRADCVASREEEEHSGEQS